MTIINFLNKYTNFAKNVVPVRQSSRSYATYPIWISKDLEREAMLTVYKTVFRLVVMYKSEIWVLRKMFSPMKEGD